MMNEYIGAIHIHTNYSDGGGSVWDVVTAAQRAGVDFVVVSDHGSLGALEDGWTGYHKGVLVLVATEVTCNNKAHLLVFDLTEVEGLTNCAPAEALEIIKSRGGKAFVAHPHAAKTSWCEFGAGDWESWDLGGFRGLEIWSLMHDVCNRMKPWDVLPLYRKLLSRVKGPHPEVLRQWDRLTQTRQVPAIGALDSHAKRLPFIQRPMLDYYDTFATLRTHVLAPPLDGEPRTDARHILDAILAGRCFVALDDFSDARGFSFVGLAREEHILMGQEVRFGPPLQFHIRAPQEAELRLVKNGQVLVSSEGNNLVHTADAAGVYRAEAHINGRPWVFTNPIYLRAGAGEES